MSARAPSRVRALWVAMAGSACARRAHARPRPIAATTLVFLVFRSSFIDLFSFSRSFSFLIEFARTVWVLYATGPPGLQRRPHGDGGSGRLRDPRKKSSRTT